MTSGQTECPTAAFAASAGLFRYFSASHLSSPIPHHEYIGENVIRREYLQQS